MKTVITYGTYDLLHVGHINLLKRAKEMGDYLIVAVSTDSFNQLKGKEAYYNYTDRKKILESISYVDKVIMENEWNQKKKDINKYNVDIFVMGDDWKGEFDYLASFCEVRYISRTPNISSTKIKEDLTRLQY